MLKLLTLTLFLLLLIDDGTGGGNDCKTNVQHKDACGDCDTCADGLTCKSYKSSLVAISQDLCLYDRPFESFEDTSEIVTSILRYIEDKW